MAGCRPFKPDEVTTLLEYFGRPDHGLPGLRNRALLQMGVSTGFRISEMLKLRIWDVYRNGRVFDVVKNPKGNRKKQGSGQTKALYKLTQQYLQEWIEAIKKEAEVRDYAPLFLSKKGGAITKGHANKVLRNACVECGISVNGVGTHTMRKTFAATSYNFWKSKASAGEPIEVMRMVQEDLGHQSIDSTYRYLNFKLEEKPDSLFDYEKQSTSS